jgi:PAS domain S-box-containing protein
MINTVPSNHTADEALQNCLKKAFESLKDSDYKYALEEACIFIVQNGVIGYANDKITTTSKFDKVDLIGSDHSILYSCFQPGESYNNLQSTIAAGKIWKGEVKSTAKDGSHYWVDITIIPILNDEDLTFYYVTIGADITMLKSHEELINVNKELAFQQKEKDEHAAELIIAKKELVFHHREKEKLAAELIIADKELAYQIEEKEKRTEELDIANKALVFQNVEKENRADELVIANIELDFQNVEKQKRAAELIIADIELAFQTEEKGKRAEELIIANKELDFQNEEKEQRASELIIANRELDSYSYSV